MTDNGPTALDRIIAYKRREVAERKQETSASELESRISVASAPRGFISALRSAEESGRNGLICELKRKSPSAGDILPGANPVDIARDYEAGGAACLSVLTDGPSFGGTIADLVAVRGAVSLPVLRKDFMIDPWQVREARAYGADAILVILSAVTPALAAWLMREAGSLGMDALVEVHDEEELQCARDLGAPLIGVNNRNLQAMTTDLGVSARLAGAHHDLHGMVSESGVKTAEDIRLLRTSGYRRFLIGESLMLSTDRQAATKALVQTS